MPQAPTASPDTPDGLAQGALEDLVGYNLKRAYVVVQNDFRAAMGEGGLSPRVFAALALVVENPGLTQSDLARRLGIERSGLVAIVDALDGKRYLRRVAVPGDRRVQSLLPTPAGRTACDAALARVRAHENSLLDGLSDAERVQLLTLLRKVRLAAGTPG